MIGVKADVDLVTGWRASGVDPRKREYLLSPHWLALGSDGSGYEIFLIPDADAGRFQGRPGCTVLHTESAINKAVQAMAGTTYAIQSEALVAQSIASKSIDISDLDSSMAPSKVAEALYNRGALGVAKVERRPPNFKTMRTRAERFSQMKKAGLI